MSDGDEAMVMLSVRVPRHLKQRLEEVASASGATLQDLVGTAVEAELDVWDELYHSRRAAFAKLARERNELRYSKLIERVRAHIPPITP
jgi:predicted DNA-binding protein